MRAFFPFGRVQSRGETKSNLLPLTPIFEQASHEVYFREIESALTGNHRTEIKNIALTGSYGVGKSSILKKVAAAHKDTVVQVSLSTLGLPDEDDAPASAPTGAKSKTNRIQKEIVKQLLYREDPDRTPGSRFRRIGRFKKWRGLGLAGLFSIALSVVFYLAGWTSKLVELLKPHFDPGLWAHLGLFTMFTGFIFALEWSSHNRLRIQSFTAGYATVSLSPEIATYFDQYLDEIVYFFEVTKSDVVIFEDIDRFDDPHIFETLQALNSLLNGAKQLSGRTVRFIYAIKDSIFDELGYRAAREARNTDGQNRADAVDTELARANRTKFFDLVIPVVPFITHRSARDLMARTMSDIQHRVSNELIDLASRYMADMRLIKNVRNEFVIFRQMVLKTDDGDLALSEDSLFAMMLYKNTHLSDFEQIKSGKSNLDHLCLDFRTIINENITRLHTKSSYLGDALSNQDSVAERSDEFGQELIGYIDRLCNQAAFLKWNARSLTMNLNTWSESDLRAPEFWRALAESETDSTLSLSLYDRQVGMRQVVISRSDVAQIVGDPLSVVDWQEVDRNELLRRKDEIKKDLEFLSGAHMHDLVEHEKYTLSTGETFKQLAAKYLGSRMAQQLVEEGYLDRDFTLYTAIYYSERVTTRAQNFLIHNVASNVMDIYFQLEPEDVKAIVQERGESVLRERCMYNAKVLDYLLESGGDRLDHICKALAALGEDETQFLSAYLIAGSGREPLIRRLTGLSDSVILFIVSQPQLEEPETVKLLDASLQSTVEGRRYVVDEEVRAFIEKHYAELVVFTSPATDTALATRLVTLLVAMNARLSALPPLGDEVRRWVVAESRYMITRENLVAALEGAEGLALDQILKRNETVYRYVVRHLPEYLVAIRDTDPAARTIESPDLFGRVVTDVTDSAKLLLAEVLAMASPRCQLLRLADVPKAAWPALANGHWFPTTFENTAGYMESLGGIDAYLAGHLQSAAEIEVAEGVPESDKVTLACELLAARDVLPDPKTRVSLVVSLGLTDCLEPSQVEPEAGHLLGLLINQAVIEDTAGSFVLARSADWETREYAISKSEQFSSFMTPAEVPAGDVAALMASSIVPDKVKSVILHRTSEFMPNDDRTVLTAVAEFAARTQEKVSYEVVVRFASSHVDPSLLLRVLEPQLNEFSESQLVPILKAMGDVYEDLAERNGKRPKLQNTEADLNLVKRLEELGVVSSYQIIDDQIWINMKKVR